MSKQGSNMLSTCLSSPLVFVYRQDRSHQPIAYLLKTSKSPRSPTPSISDIPYTSLPNRLGERHLRDVSLQLKVLYFRLSSESVIIFASYGLSCVFIVLPNNALHAYIPLLLAVKTKQPPVAFCSQLECKDNKKLQNRSIAILEISEIYYLCR